MLIYEGENLELYKRDFLKIQNDWNRRDFTYRVEQYLESVTEKVFAVVGLRGTGKTVGILQAAKNSIVFIFFLKKKV
ncbi:MAG: hypothetical protein IJU76_02755 [Desulfovibrionaceae bacterium]|nr:hypothetical protein [Desulfovibrionaceae bacterium]